MSSGYYEFTAEFADVAVGIRCRHGANRAFLSDYFSERDPDFSIDPTGDDLEQTRLRLDRQAEKDGLPLSSYTDAYLENNAIHTLLAEGLARYGILLMHGSALCMDGEAYIFTAASGTGKSTHARLWREVFGSRVWMINDDKPLLRVGADGKTSVYGTPWNGKHHISRNASAPLKAIVSLQRGTENRIAPLPPVQAFTELRRRVYTPADREAAANILALESRLLDAVSFYRLQCNMERDAALIAWQGMNSDRVPS